MDRKGDKGRNRQAPSATSTAGPRASVAPSAPRGARNPLFPPDTPQFNQFDFLENEDASFTDTDNEDDSEKRESKPADISQSSKSAVSSSKPVSVTSNSKATSSTPSTATPHPPSTTSGAHTTDESYDDEEEYEDGEYEEYDEDEEEDSSVPTFNVFVGDLSPDVTDDELYAAFESCGDIHSVTVIRDRYTGASRRYGFVNFLNDEARQRALQQFTEVQICGHWSRASASDSKATLYLGNLSRTVTEAELARQLEEIAGPFVHLNLKNGYGFVTYVNFRQSCRASTLLQHQEIGGRRINVQMAKARSNNSSSSDPKDPSQPSRRRDETEDSIASAESNASSSNGPSNRISLVKPRSSNQPSSSSSASYANALTHSTPSSAPPATAAAAAAPKGLSYASVVHSSRATPQAAPTASSSAPPSKPLPPLAAASKPATTHSHSHSGYARVNGHTLYVRIPSHMTDKSFRDMFSPYGTLLRAVTVKDIHTGKPRGYGFAEFEHRHEADAALDALNGTFFDGQLISVEHSINRTRRGPSNSTDAYSTHSGSRYGDQDGSENGANDDGYSVSDSVSEAAPASAQPTASSQAPVESSPASAPPPSSAAPPSTASAPAAAVSPSSAPAPQAESPVKASLPASLDPPSAPLSAIATEPVTVIAPEPVAHSVSSASASSSSPPSASPPALGISSLRSPRGAKPETPTSDSGIVFPQRLGFRMDHFAFPTASGPSGLTPVTEAPLSSAPAPFQSASVGSNGSILGSLVAGKFSDAPVDTLPLSSSSLLGASHPFLAPSNQQPSTPPVSSDAAYSAAGSPFQPTRQAALNGSDGYPSNMNSSASASLKLRAPPSLGLGHSSGPFSAFSSFPSKSPPSDPFPDSSPLTADNQGDFGSNEMLDSNYAFDTTEPQTDMPIQRDFAAAFKQTNHLHGKAAPGFTSVYTAQLPDAITGRGDDMSSAFRGNKYSLPSGSPTATAFAYQSASKVMQSPDRGFPRNAPPPQQQQQQQQPQYGPVPTGPGAPPSRSAFSQYSRTNGSNPNPYAPQVPQGQALGQQQQQRPSMSPFQNANSGPRLSSPGYPAGPGSMGLKMAQRQPMGAHQMQQQQLQQRGLVGGYEPDKSQKFLPNSSYAPSASGQPYANPGSRVMSRMLQAQLGEYSDDGNLSMDSLGVQQLNRPMQNMALQQHGYQQQFPSSSHLSQSPHDAYGASYDNDGDGAWYGDQQRQMGDHPNAFYDEQDPNAGYDGGEYFEDDQGMAFDGARGVGLSNLRSAPQQRDLYYDSSSFPDSNGLRSKQLQLQQQQQQQQQQQSSVGYPRGSPQQAHSLGSFYSGSGGYENLLGGNPSEANAIPRYRSGGASSNQGLDSFGDQYGNGGLGGLQSSEQLPMRSNAFQPSSYAPLHSSFPQSTQSINQPQHSQQTQQQQQLQQQQQWESVGGPNGSSVTPILSSLSSEYPAFAPSSGVLAPHRGSLSSALPALPQLHTDSQSTPFSPPPASPAAAIAPPTALPAARMSASPMRPVAPTQSAGAHVPQVAALPSPPVVLASPPPSASPVSQPVPAAAPALAEKPPPVPAAAPAPPAASAAVPETKSAASSRPPAPAPAPAPPSVAAPPPAPKPAASAAPAPIAQPPPSQPARASSASGPAPNGVSPSPPAAAPAAAPAAPTSSSSSSNTKLYIGNVPRGWREENVRKFLAATAPNPQPVAINLKVGFCFLVYADNQAAATAADLLKDATVEGGRSLTVQFARPNSSSRDRERGAASPTQGSSPAASSGPVSLVKRSSSGSYSSGSHPRSSSSTRTLYIQNLGPRVTEDELKALFVKYGTVSRVSIVKHQNGQSKGYGFVELDDGSNSQACDRAISALNDTVLDGQAIRVEYSRGSK